MRLTSKSGKRRAWHGIAAMLLCFLAVPAQAEESRASYWFRQTVYKVVEGPSALINKTIDLVFYGSTAWHREKFFELLETSGYELKKAETTAGLIPEIKFAYEQARQLSENDREALEEEILAFEESDPTWIEGKIEARILRFLLSVSEMGQYRIGEFDISVLPLPGFTFATMPAEISYTPDTILIMRRMNEARENASHAAGSKNK